MVREFTDPARTVKIPPDIWDANRTNATQDWGHGWTAEQARRDIIRGITPQMAGRRSLQGLIVRLEPVAIRLLRKQLLSSNLPQLIWRAVPLHQLCACGMAVVIAALSLAPVEIQRRTIDDAIGGSDVRLLIILCAAYGGVVILHQLVKFLLNSYQVWMGQSVTKYLRNQIIEANGDSESEPESEAIAVLVSETEQLGEFVGQGVSQAFIDISMLVGIAVYMFVVEPVIALFAIGFLIPQVVISPIIQARLNRLMENQVRLKRRLSKQAGEETAQDSELHTTTQRLYGNKILFAFLKFAMKALLNLLSALAPISILAVGGYLAINGQTSVGVIVAFLSGYQRFAEPVKGMITFYRNAAQANVQHNLIVDWLNGKH